MITIHSAGKELHVYPAGAGHPFFREQLSAKPAAHHLKNALARDLVRIGQAIFTADRDVRRVMRVGGQTRAIRLSLGLEVPEVFSAAQDALIRFVAFTTRDEWDFQFSKLPDATQESEKTLSSATASATCVSLLSDGLDSLCGANKAYADGQQPIFVSHFQPRWGLSSAVKRIDDLQQQLPIAQRSTAQFVNFRFELNEADERGKRNQFPENSRRARPCLYLCYAAAVALELHCPEIRLNENGVLALNLPFNRGTVGAQISRHAHPLTLYRFQEFLQQIWPHEKPCRVFNPFTTYTKSDMVRELRSRMPAHLIEATTSCEHAGRALLTYKGQLKKQDPKSTPSFKECGICVPCLIRRQAMTANGIQEEGHYAFAAAGPSEDQGQASWIRAHAGEHEALKAYARRLIKLSGTAFLDTYLPELLALGELPGELEEEISRQYTLHQRFAEQYLDFS